jgi:hypothetical protein
MNADAAEVLGVISPDLLSICAVKAAISFSAFGIQEKDTGGVRDRAHDRGYRATLPL